MRPPGISASSLAINLIAGLVLSMQAVAVTYVVDSTGDSTLSGDTSPGDGVCGNVVGNCQWRTVIEEANARPGLDVIEFSISSAIIPNNSAGQFPAFTDQVVIRGQSAPGYPGLNHDLELAPPEVFLSGNGLGGPGGAGMLFEDGSEGSVVIAMGVVDFLEGILVHADGVQIFGCYIGVLADGTPLGNLGNGIFLTSDNNVVGQFLAAGSPQEYGNVISGNTTHGIFVSASEGNRISGNRIGTSPDGRSAVPNGMHGIQVGFIFDDDVFPADSNVIGETDADDAIGNLIAGNTGDGVHIIGSANTLEANRIGVNIDGMPQGNGGNGVHIEGDGNMVGTLSALSRNEIANDTNGIYIDGNGNQVLGNLIGFENPLQGHAEFGIAVRNAEDTIISNNHILLAEFGGIRILLSENSTINGNLVGVSYNNGEPVNAGSFSTSEGAVSLSNSFNTDVFDNVLGFYARGVQVYTSDGNIHDNFIGIDPQGRDIGNSFLGVSLRGSNGVQIINNLIVNNFFGIRMANFGDSVLNTNIEMNTIARNDNYAIQVGDINLDDENDVHLNNRLVNNVMYGNGDIGIDLGDDGFTPNDFLDQDDGHNNLQNFPVINDLSFSGNRGAEELTVTWESDALASATTYPVVAHFYLADPHSSATQGMVFLGSDSVGGEGIPRTTFLALPSGTSGGFLTATITDDVNNTSEFLPRIEFGDLLFADGLEGF